ncbi:methyltransferase domain-containing protein [Diplocarpon rosae]|nr:methyltransferase domain-containing protein [Diplocarpon rosae]
MAAAPAPLHLADGELSKISEKSDVSAQYAIPEAEPFISFDALKERIRHHYELASDYYYSLWLTQDARGGPPETPETGGAAKLGDGSVRFVELDAEKMGAYFTAEPNVARFDCVWISEAMSHLPNKELFFSNAALLLNPGGKLVVADWFKAEGLTEKQFADDISPIEGTTDGMLLPPLCAQSDYVRLAHDAGLKTFAEPLDISKQVSKTWDISWTLIQNPALWAFAVAQGRDGLAFMQAFRAMRRGFANGTFRYAVMAFQK